MNQFKNEECLMRFKVSLLLSQPSWLINESFGDVRLCNGAKESKVDGEMIPEMVKY